MNANDCFLAAVQALRAGLSLSATLFKEENVKRDAGGKFSSASISKAKGALKAGRLSVKTSQTPFNSAATNKPIRRYVELDSGHKIHPDELHRMKDTGGGHAELDKNENLSARDPAAGHGPHASFNRALATIASYPKRPNDDVTLVSPHGHTVTLKRHQWTDLHKKHRDSDTQFHHWFDAEGYAAKKAEGPSVPSAERMGQHETESMFAPQTAKSQGRLFMSATNKAPEGGLTSPVNGQFYEGGTFMPIHGQFCGKGANKVTKEKFEAVAAKVKAQSGHNLEYNEQTGDFRVKNQNGRYEMTARNLDTIAKSHHAIGLGEKKEDPFVAARKRDEEVTEKMRKDAARKSLNERISQHNTNLNLSRLYLSADPPPDDDSETLAEHYADLFNLFGHANLDVPEDLLDDANDDLKDTNWLLIREDGGWRVESGETGGIQLSNGARAPKGGVVIEGKQYKGGQWIPGTALAEATPEVKEKIEAAKSNNVNARVARGTVDLERLKSRTLPHADRHELTPQEKSAAARSFKGIHAHHGELSLHRIEELADGVHAALEKLGDDPEMEGVRHQFEKRLASYGHMLGLAKEKGVHGEIAPEHAAIAARALPVKAPKPEKVAKPPAEPKHGQVYNVPHKDLHVDPKRFQFKLNTKNPAGVTDEFKEVSHWDHNFAGVVAVWKDPADGKTYIVNGHHRHELAGRLGVDDMAVRYIDAPSAQAARAEGALINIAEGRGTAVDAAKFMRDTGKTAADFEARGVSLKGKVAADATILSDLSDKVFNRVTEGTIEQGQALAVAKHLKDHDLQNKLFKLLDKRADEGKDLRPGVVEEMAREMAAAGKYTKKEEGGLFGDMESEESLFEQRAEIKAHVRQELAKEVADFMAVSNKRRAEKVGKAAGNVLDVEANREIAREADRVKNAYDLLVNRKGAISDKINELAGELANAKTKGQRDEIKRRATAAASEAVKREVDGSGVGPDLPVSEAGAGEPTPAAGAPDAGGGSAEPAGVSEPVVDFKGEVEKARAGKEPHEMTQGEHKETIANAPNNQFVTSTTEDWGNLRGQGKRHGHMVMGGMRDSSLQGKKIYTQMFGKLPREEAEEADVGLHANGKLTYAKARAAGFDHDHAMTAGYEADGEDVSAHKEAVQAALAAGKPVPKEVLADYPELAPKPDNDADGGLKGKEPQTIDQFAAIAQRAADEHTHGFGTSKVYLSDVYDAAKPELGDMTLDEFKSKVIEARGEGKLQTGRADMPEFMPLDRVKRSETGKEHGDLGDFGSHFIRGKEKDRQHYPATAPNAAYKTEEPKPDFVKEVEKARESTKPNSAHPTPDTVRTFYDQSAHLPKEEFEAGLAEIDKLKGKALEDVARKLGMSVKVSGDDGRRRVKQFISDRRGATQRAGMTELVGAGKGEAKVPADPLDIKPDNLKGTWEHVKERIAKTDPKMSPNLAGHLAAEHILHAVDKRANAYIKEIDAKVKAGEPITDEEDAKYIEAGEKRRSLFHQMVSISGYRPGADSPDHPEVAREWDSGAASNAPAPSKQPGKTPPLPREQAASQSVGRSADPFVAEVEKAREPVNYDHAVTIAADSVEKLRKQDVYRVLDSMQDVDNLHGMMRHLAKKRPDLADEIEDAAKDIREERGYA